MAKAFSDDFTGTNGTALNGRSVTGGATWVAGTISGSGAFEIQSNQASLTVGSGGGLSYASMDTAADTDSFFWQVTIPTFTVQATDTFSFLLYLSAIDASAGYYALLRSSTGTLIAEIRRADTDATVVAASTPSTLTGTWRFVRMPGAQALIHDGVTVASSSDTSQTSGADQRYMATLTNCANGDATNLLRLDDMSAGDVSAFRELTLLGVGI